MRRVTPDQFWETFGRVAASRGPTRTWRLPRRGAHINRTRLDRPGSFRLDGAAGYPGLGERTFLGHSPMLSVTLIDDTWTVRWPDRDCRFEQPFDVTDPFGPLRRVTEILRRDGDPPFAGAAVGAITYEFGERMLGLTHRRLREPVVRFDFHDRVVSLRDGALELTCAGLRRTDGEHAPDTWIDALNDDGSDVPRNDRGDMPPPRVIGDSLPHGPYVRALSRIKAYIAAGDIYQANLTRMLRVELPTSPAAFYDHLRRTHPAPFSALLVERDGAATLGISPELFLRVDGRQIATRPIKGTRPRGATPSEDRRLKAELLGSEKDAAELLMIVDLMRNDLGRVAEYGSVRVPEPRRCDVHPTLYHLSGGVEARLARDRTGWDLLAAALPAGSITGAPKRRAVEILQDLEPHARGVYTGAVGMIDFSGRMVFNVAIRTMRVVDGVGKLGIGGGIVADSDPDEEFAETLVKAKAFLAPAVETHTARVTGGHLAVDSLL